MHCDNQLPIVIRVKAIPGASRDAVAGMLDDRLKVRISAAPEDGKANKAICKLIAQSLAIKPNQVQVINGHTNPLKSIQLNGCTLDHIKQSLNIDDRVISS